MKGGNLINIFSYQDTIENDRVKLKLNWIQLKVHVKIVYAIFCLVWFGLVFAINLNTNLQLCQS